MKSTIFVTVPSARRISTRRVPWLNHVNMLLLSTRTSISIRNPHAYIRRNEYAKSFSLYLVSTLCSRVLVHIYSLRLPRGPTRTSLYIAYIAPLIAWHSTFNPCHVPFQILFRVSLDIWPVLALIYLMLLPTPHVWSGRPCTGVLQMYKYTMYNSTIFWYHCTLPDSQKIYCYWYQ